MSLAATPILAGRYKLLTSIGSGGMGEVFVAEHLPSRQIVAIKLLSATLLSPRHVARFVREARVMLRLRGRHVARIIDVGRVDSKQPYIVMEHLEGQDFARLLQTCGRLGIEDAVGSVIQASSALAEAHAMGIVHRDLKPSNLFLTRGPDGRFMVKVLDFGISMIPEELGWDRITASAEVFGTPEYMSPEQARSAKQVDARTDIWSLGLILAECLSGIPVFKGAMQLAALAEGTGDPVLDLHLEATDVPPDLEAVIRRCLEKEPGDRYQDVAELAKALSPFARREALLSGLSVAPIAHSPSQHDDTATLDQVTHESRT